MHIYPDGGNGPMITGDADELRHIGALVESFLGSEESSLFIPSDIPASGLTFKKSGGPILVEQHPNLALDISGNPDNLRVWAEHFYFDLEKGDNGHHHPEYVDRPNYIDPRSLSVIIELEFSDSPRA